MATASAVPSNCGDVPPLVSSFVDAFVDFSVSGLFFPEHPASNGPPPPIHPPPPPTRLPAPERLVAVGDLHGDLPKSLSALSLAGLVDPSTLRWTGGPTVAVQVGDVLDRGGDELRLLYLFHRLKLDAARAGGALLTLHGNHEIMNADGDFRFATRAGLDEFSRWGLWFRSGLAMKRMCADLPPPPDPFRGVPRSFPGVKERYWDGIHARIAALRPSGPIAARFLAGNQTVLVVGDSVFVHGGLLNLHIDHGLERINQEVRDWITGKSAAAAGGGDARLTTWYLRDRESLVWLRRFSDAGPCDCERLEQVLAGVPGARRMVMGHSIQRQGINGACDGRAVRIDVGLSKGCGDGLPEVLEINGGGEEVRILTANPLYDKAAQRQSKRRREEEETKPGLGILISDRNVLQEVEVKS